MPSHDEKSILENLSIRVAISVFSPGGCGVRGWGGVGVGGHWFPRGGSCSVFFKTPVKLGSINPELIRKRQANWAVIYDVPLK